MPLFIFFFFFPFTISLLLYLLFLTPITPEICCNTDVISRFIVRCFIFLFIFFPLFCVAILPTGSCLVYFFLCIHFYLWFTYFVKHYFDFCFFYCLFSHCCIGDEMKFFKKDIFLKIMVGAAIQFLISSIHHFIVLFLTRTIIFTCQN